MMIIDADAEMRPEFVQILTPQALAFVAALQRRFGARRAELLAARAERQRALDASVRPDFLEETSAVRAGDWRKLLRYLGPLPPLFDFTPEELKLFDAASLATLIPPHARTASNWRGGGATGAGAVAQSARSDMSLASPTAASSAAAAAAMPPTPDAAAGRPPPNTAVSAAASSAR